MHRINLALYNTYDKLRWHEAHKRAIARASPIAKACEGNLILLDFPVKSKEEVIEKVKDTTLDIAFLKGEKFHVMKALPPQFGIAIATTSKPKKEKSISPNNVVRLLEKNSICLIIGLGRKGLPKEIKDKAKYHLDITMKGIPLETCTAIGAIPLAIYHLRRRK